MGQQFDINAYVTVNERIRAFWKDHPTGRIVTDIFHLDDASFENRMVVIKAEVYIDNSPNTPPSAVDWAKEREGVGYVSKTSFIENASTSAIGRALATLGYLVDKNRASREEIEAVQRSEQEHQVILDKIKTLAKGGTAEMKTLVKEQWAMAKEDKLTATKLLEEVVVADGI